MRIKYKIAPNCAINSLVSFGLDDTDYALAEHADLDESADTIAFDELLQDLGISYEELQAD